MLQDKETLQYYGVCLSLRNKGGKAWNGLGHLKNAINCQFCDDGKRAFLATVNIIEVLLVPQVLQIIQWDGERA